MNEQLIIEGGDADQAEYEQPEEAPQEPVDEETILSIIGTEMEQSATGTFSTELDGNREESLAYYLGNPRGDEVEGRSQIVSTDVADAIEWILPQIIKALVAKGSIVEFDAVNEADESQAELETVFTHDVFMKENEGFLNLYEYIKDALMQKNGIFKIYYDETEKVTTESYDGLNKQELEMLLSQQNVKPVTVEGIVDEQARQLAEQQLQQQQLQIQQQMSQAGAQQVEQQMLQLEQQMQQLAQEPPMIYACSIEVTHLHGKVRVDCIPPEEFRVVHYHDSLALDKARFSAHVRLRTRSELICDGYDPEIVNNASDNVTDTYEREYRFAEQGEDTAGDYNYSEDKSQQLLEVSECYIQMDVDGTGKSKLMQVTVLGSENPTDILEITPIDSNPFVASSCIIMAHKFYGLSIYDRLKQLQDQKTSLWRNILDNLYLQNNREKEVVENQVNIDDLLVSRPGGIKRVKAPGMIRELQVQPIGQEGYQMLDYLDQVRTGRVGVSPDSAGQIDALGTAVGSEGVARLQTAKEELTGLMVRVIAETGLKAAYVKIRDLLVKYKNNQTDFKFKGEWAQVNPAQWGERSRTTVKVGTGTGDDERKVGAIQQAIAYQAQIKQEPGQTLVTDVEVYESLDEFCRVSGLTGANPYFLDPRSTEGQQRKQQMGQQQQAEQQKQEQLQQAMAKAQQDMANAEMMKGQASLQAQEAKVMIEQGKMQMQSVTDQGKINTEQGKLEMERVKQQSENTESVLELELKKANMEIDALKAHEKQKFDYAKLEQEEALKLTEMEQNAKLKLADIYSKNVETAEKTGDDPTKGEQ